MAPRVPHQFFYGIEHKICCRCKQLKVIDDYYPNPRAWDKLLARCKQCDCNRVKNSLKNPENRKEDENMITNIVGAKGVKKETKNIERLRMVDKNDENRKRATD